MFRREKCGNYFQTCLQNYIREEKAELLYDAKTSPFPSDDTAGEFNYRLTAYVNNLHSFKFDTENQSFDHCDKTSACLNYIEKDVYLDVEEMFNLAGFNEQQFGYPYLEKPDICDKLWEICTGKTFRQRKGKNSGTERPALNKSIDYWNALCTCLGRFRNLLTKKEFDDKLNQGESSKEFFITREEFRNKLDYTKDLSGKADGAERDFIELIKDGFLEEVESKAGRGYVYADESIKSILKKAGNLLEYYLYYTILEEGWADDIRNGAKMVLPEEYDLNDEAFNEIDLMITKGFKCIIVECKNTNNLTKNFYSQLNTIVDCIDPGIHKVIVKNGDVDKMSRERGRRMNIRTFAIKEDEEKTHKDDKKDIREVVNEIRKIME